MKVPANEVRKDMKVLDQLGREIEVTEAWPSQGKGLGVVVIGYLVSSPSVKSVNRYIMPDEAVEVIYNG